MPKLEKFGSFVLLEEVAGDYMGRIFRAGKLTQTGLEKVVYLTKISPNITHDTTLMKSLIDELKATAQLASPNIAKVYGCGKIEGAYFISWEFVEGKDLGVVFTRMNDGFPLALDQSLYVVSRIVAALETAHSTRIGDKPILHGALSPVDVLLTYEGDVKVKNFGVADVLSKHPAETKEAYRRIETYLSPEFLEGKPPDRRSDIYSLGLIFYRMMTGEPFFTAGRDIDIKQRLDSSRVLVPYQDEEGLPIPVNDFLLKCLHPSPAGRFASVKDVRQAIEALLLHGDFSPSTFNLAFFMHTAFRTEIDGEAKVLQDEKKINFLEYVIEQSAPAPTPTAPKGALEGAITQVLPSKEVPAVKEVKAPTATEAPARPPVAAKPVEAHPAAPAFGEYAEKPEKKSPILLVAILAAVLVLGGVGVYFLFLKPSAGQQGTDQTQVQQLSTEQAKRLAELEEAAKKAEEEKSKMATELEALKKLQDDAAKAADKEKAAKIAEQIKVKQDEQRKQEEAEKQRIAEQEALKRQQDEAAKAVEQTKLDEQRKAEEEAAKKAEAAKQAALQQQQQAAQVQEGDLVSIDSCDVRPKITRSVNPAFPPMAQRMNASGSVTVTVLVSENGDIIDAKITKPSGSKYGFDEAAMDAARKYKFSPGTKSGKRIRVWYMLPVFNFKKG